MTIINCTNEVKGALLAQKNGINTIAIFKLQTPQRRLDGTKAIYKVCLYKNGIELRKAPTSVLSPSSEELISLFQAKEILGTLRVLEKNTSVINLFIRFESECEKQFRIQQNLISEKNTLKKA